MKLVVDGQAALSEGATKLAQALQTAANSIAAQLTDVPRDVAQCTERCIGQLDAIVAALAKVPQAFVTQPEDPASSAALPAEPSANATSAAADQSEGEGNSDLADALAVASESSQTVLMAVQDSAALADRMSAALAAVQPYLDVHQLYASCIDKESLSLRDLMGQIVALEQGDAAAESPAESGVASSQAEAVLGTIGTVRAGILERFKTLDDEFEAASSDLEICIRKALDDAGHESGDWKQLLQTGIAKLSADSELVDSIAADAACALEAASSDPGSGAFQANTAIAQQDALIAAVDESLEALRNEIAKLIIDLHQPVDLLRERIANCTNVLDQVLVVVKSVVEQIKGVLAEFSGNASDVEKLLLGLPDRFLPVAGTITNTADSITVIKEGIPAQ